MTYTTDILEVRQVTRMTPNMDAMSPVCAACRSLPELETQWRYVMAWHIMRSGRLRGWVLMYIFPYL
jgi:hypothetical protein